MAELRIVREAVEALVVSPSRGAVTRLATESAAEDGGTGGQVTVLRQGVEVMADRRPQVEATRLATESAAEDGGTGGQVTILRQAVEAMIQVPQTVAVNRITTESAGVDGGVGGTVSLLRQGIEVMGSISVPAPTPLALATAQDFFDINWASEVDMETAFSTDITRSPFTLTEERRSLQQRPQRAVTYRWSRKSVAEYDRLIILLRRLTGENMQGVLFQDSANVTVAQGLTEAAVYCDAANKRFFSGQRILVSRMSDGFQPFASVEILTILVVSPTKIITTSIPSQVFDPNDLWTVFPLIDCEQKLDAEQTDMTTDVIDMSIELFEFRGPSALPPSSSSLPDNWQVAFGLPVWEIEPNWARGVPRGYKRYGVMQQQGRAVKPKVEGDRYAQTQRFDLVLDRPDFWRVLQFFESRRGRTIAFWAVDREQQWVVTDTDTNFIDVRPLGEFSDFNAIWTEDTSGAGIVMEDGTVYVRHINTVQEVAGIWRLTLALGETLPAIVVADISRFARARTSRFDSDAMTEKWTTTDVARVSLSTIETINEQDVGLTP